MAGIHRIFFDMLERTYAFGPYAEAQDDVLNYLGFAEASFYHMMEHHEAEGMFSVHHSAPSSSQQRTSSSRGSRSSLAWQVPYARPVWQLILQTIWDDNIAEHHDFDDHLAASYVWLRRCREALNPPTQDPIPAPTAAHKAKLDLFPDLAKTRTFDATTLQKHMDSFINKLSTHLVHEVQMLKADNLKTTDQAHMQQLFEELGKYIQRHDPKWYLVALICESAAVSHGYTDTCRRYRLGHTQFTHRTPPSRETRVTDLAGTAMVRPILACACKLLVGR